MRIYSSTNEPMDFCDECAPSEREARIRFGNLGDGPDGRGNCFAYDADHPPYDMEWYDCYECGERVIDGEEEE